MVTLVVDAANVVGSRPDGWWRDRAGAASRLLGEVAALPGRDVDLPGRDVDGSGRGPVRIGEVVVVLEGRARDAVPPQELPAAVQVVRAGGYGDDEIVARAGTAPPPVVVVTADRGLRERLPAGVVTVGPSWLRALLES